MKTNDAKYVCHSPEFPSHVTVGRKVMVPSPWPDAEQPMGSTFLRLASKFEQIHQISLETQREGDDVRFLDEDVRATLLRRDECTFPCTTNARRTTEPAADPLL